MVPGGEKLTVLKAPYSWKNTPEKYKDYPIVVSRMGNYFNAPFTRVKPSNMRLQSLDQKDIVAYHIEELNKRAQDLQDKGAQVLVMITGHYNERSPGVGEGMMRGSAVYDMFGEQLKLPGAYLANSIPACKKAHPASVRSDLFHASSTANWLEGLEIMRALCKHDGIQLPEAIPALVAKNVAEDTKAMSYVAVDFPGKDFDPETNLLPGDQITVTATIAPEAGDTVHVMLHQIAGADYYLADQVAVPADRKLTYTWTVVNELPKAGNNLGRLPTMSAAPVTPMPDRKFKNPQKRYCFRIISTKAPADMYDFSGSFRVGFSKPAREQPRLVKPDK